ncbi:MAG: hypothetical protein IEMM0008_1018 [bacterium]|nr:MAG: hypothetical protein IEMM0008_1018 [bacterium]
MTFQNHLGMLLGGLFVHFFVLNIIIGLLEGYVLSRLYQDKELHFPYIKMILSNTASLLTFIIGFYVVGLGSIIIYFIVRWVFFLWVLEKYKSSKRDKYYFVISQVVYSLVIVAFYMLVFNI